MIRTGNELEKIIRDETPDAMKVPLESAISLEGGLFYNDVQVVFQPRMPAARADIVVFDHPQRKSLIIELILLLLFLTTRMQSFPV